MRTNGNQHRVISRIEDVIKVIDPVVQTQVDTEVDNVLDLALDNFGGQAVFGNPQTQHPADNRHRLEQRHTIARTHEVLRSGQTTWPRADDCDALLVEALCGFDRLARFGVDFVGDEAFERADIDRLVDQTAIAGRLTAVVTDPAADAGEGIVHLDHAHRVVPATLADQSDVALSTLPGRTGISTGGDSAFLNSVSVGDSLGIALVHRPTGC